MRFLVTGAAGSIGSEVCRQLLDQGADVVGFDIAETPLFHLGARLPGLMTMLGDVRSWQDLTKALGLEINHIIHCAAVKHVGMVERNQRIAYQINVEGTYNIAGCGVPWTLLSTDKAVDPVTYMGRTKAIAELVALASGASVARLVNVWGSQGSVVDVFQRAIANGKPLPIHDDGAIRYFCSIEAAGRDVIHVATSAPDGSLMIARQYQALRVAEVADKVLQEELIASDYPRQTVKPTWPVKPFEQLQWGDERVQAVNGENYVLEPHVRSPIGRVNWASLSQTDISELRQWCFK